MGRSPKEMKGDSISAKMAAVQVDGGPDSSVRPGQPVRAQGGSMCSVPGPRPRSPGRGEACSGRGGLTSELLRGVVQVPSCRLHHTAVIHQPGGQGGSVSRREEPHLLTASLHQGRGSQSTREATKVTSPSLTNPSPSSFPFLAPWLKGKISWGGVGSPQKKLRDTSSPPQSPG